MAEGPNPLTVTESQRDLGAARVAHPQGEIWRFLRRQAKARQDEREQSARRGLAERERFRAVVADMALVHHQFRSFAAIHLPSIRLAGSEELADLLQDLVDRHLRALTGAGARLVWIDGEPLTDSMTGWVEVISAVPTPGLTGPQVQATRQPAVFLGTELIAPARVVVATPASPADGDRPPHDSPTELPATGDEDPAVETSDTKEDDPWAR